MVNNDKRMAVYLSSAENVKELYGNPLIGEMLRGTFTTLGMDSDSFYSNFADIFGDVILGLEKSSSIIPALISLGIKPETAKQTAEEVMKLIYPDKEFVFVLPSEPATPTWASETSPTEQSGKTLTEKVQEAAKLRQVLPPQPAHGETPYVEPPVRKSSYNAMLDVPNYTTPTQTDEHRVFISLNKKQAQNQGSFMPSSSAETPHTQPAEPAPSSSLLQPPSPFKQPPHSLPL